MENKRRYLDIKTQRTNKQHRSSVFSTSQQHKNKRRFKIKKENKQLLIKLVVVVLLCGALIVFGLFAWISRTLPDDNDINNSIVAENTIIYDKTGEHVLYEIHGDEKRNIVPFSDFSDHLKKAFIAVEDQQFYSHGGFNLWGMTRCAIKGVFGQMCGGSTITQQYIKNAILGNKKTPIRKIKELIIAYAIEKKFTKDQILEKYLNTIPFGSNYYGAEAAAQGYFGKPVHELNLAESATLAAMVQRPSYYSPYGNNVDKLKLRELTALELMKNEGYITETQLKEARDYKLEFKENITNITAPHFVFYVKEQLVEQFGESFVEKGGLRVYTTLDYDKQKIAEDVITKNEDKLAESEANNVSLVAIEPKTGQILTMIGSRDYFNDEIDGKVNVALRPRQPGSSIKPLVYIRSFEKGYTPETIFFDTYTQFSTDTGKPYEPKNYDDKEMGPLSLAKALGGSRNLPAVKLLYMVGIEDFIKFAEKLGYTTFADRSRFGLSLVLGGGEVKLLEHTSAYATLANNGIKKNVISILRIEDKNKNILFEWKDTPGEQVIDNESVAAINNVLSNNENRAWIFGQNNLLVVPGHTVAAKTGTTNSYNDGWLMGYTPSIATGVWVGNTDNSPMRRGDGGSRVAGPVWNGFMREALKNTPDEAFSKYIPKKIDKPLFNGLPYSTERVAIDTISGKRATEQTPAQTIIRKEFSAIHDILHYADKNDPTGLAPTNPGADPQYTLWEDGLKKWLDTNTDNPILKELNFQSPPSEYDDIHKAEDIPNIEIVSPYDDSSVMENISVTTRTKTVRPAQRIEYYIDDQKIESSLLSGQTGEYQYEKNISIPLGIEQGKHSLKVRIFDDIENTALSQKSFVLERQVSSPISIYWNNFLQEPVPINDFPKEFTLPINGDKSRIKQIDFFYTNPLIDTGGFIDYVIPKDEVSIIWNTPPDPGTYRIYAIITGVSGDIYRDSGTLITIAPRVIEEKKEEEIKTETITTE